MFFRKATVSDECMEWLEKSGSSDVKPELAKKMFENRCNQIQDEVLNTLITTSKEPASANGKTEIVVEVRLAKAEKLRTMMVVTRVYAVVYAKNKKKYYVMLDENRQLKKALKIGNDLVININGGDYIELLKTVDSKIYRISM